MALSIKSSTATANTCPTHAAGDLLLAWHACGSYDVNSGWTTIYKTGPTWSYDEITVAYRVATEGNTGAPFYNTFGLARCYAITGFKDGDPIAGSATGHGSAWSSPNPVTISSVTVPGGGLRFTFFSGYGGGGNTPFGATPTVSSGTVVDSSGYAGVVEGTNSGTFTVSGTNLLGGNLAWATVAINPAPSSGFFAMF